ncbi:IS30 family transposase [Paenibacillus sp. DS2015]
MYKEIVLATDEELAKVIQLINNHPRKFLGWMSAHEAFMDELPRLD